MAAVMAGSQTPLVFMVTSLLPRDFFKQACEGYTAAILFPLPSWETWPTRKIFSECNSVVGGVTAIGEWGREVDGVLGGEERERGEKEWEGNERGEREWVEKREGEMEKRQREEGRKIKEE